MNNWAQAASEQKLWVVNMQTSDPWFIYFDVLSQFEISRSTQKFKKSNSWIFSGSKYFPSPAILFTDFSTTDANDIKKKWQNLGSPKTFIFTSQNNGFYKNISSDQPDAFTPITELP